MGYELTLADIAVYSSLRGKEREREGRGGRERRRKGRGGGKRRREGRGGGRGEEEGGERRREAHMLID